MREHFIVDNSTTPDWEVIPLGPVDKGGRKVSLSTATLFADSGMELTVRRLSTCSARAFGVPAAMRGSRGWTICT